VDVLDALAETTCDYGIFGGFRKENFEMKMQKFLALLLACAFLTLSFLSCSGGSTDAATVSASSVYKGSDSAGYTFDRDIINDFQFDGYDFIELRKLAQIAEEYEAEDYEDEEYYEDEEAEYEYEDDEDIEEDYAEDETEDDNEYEDFEYSDETEDDEEGE
jgi:hypothetical protein